MNATKIYTTGEIAQLCQVSPRTVSKWIDTGQLPGYHIPARPGSVGQGKGDRRVTTEALAAFTRAQGMMEAHRLVATPIDELRRYWTALLAIRDGGGDLIECRTLAAEALDLDGPAEGQ